MSKTIEINDIVDANSHNSAMALTASWANLFKKYALEDYEELSDDPASSFNIFTHLTAQGAAKMMYEQEARIAEANVSTAILPKSLLNRLSSDEMKGIFGNPASTTIAFCVKKSEIISNSVLEDSTTGLRRLVINKGLKINFESYPEFTLPYNVIINVKPIKTTVTDTNGNSSVKIENNIYAYYDMPSLENDGMRDTYGINSQYISSREMRFEGDTYIAFFFKVYQMTRTETEFYVSDPYTCDTKITFSDYLVGFEVYRKKVGSSGWQLMTGSTEGSAIASNGYNFSYDYKRNKQNFNVIFSKMDDNTALTVGDTIKIITYSTKGSEGNIEFPYMIHNINTMSASYDQDLSIANQNAMLNIICLVFARDKNSSGGTDQLSLEEIRRRIINKNYSRQILITSNEIVNKGKENNLAIKQIQHDLTTMSYRGTDKITYNNMVLSTGTNNFYFDISKKEKLLRGYNYYLIEPTDVFEYNSDSRRFIYKPEVDGTNPENNLEPYIEYVNKYNSSSDPDSIKQVVFPFYIRYENTTNPKINIYDMCVNQIEYLSFDYYDESVALDKLDISFIRVERNPYRGSTNGSFDKDLKNTYFVSFIVYTGENTLNKLSEQMNNTDVTKNYVNSTLLSEYSKQYLTFEVNMVGINNQVKYTINPTKVQIVNTDTMLSDGYIAYQAVFTTDNFISDNKQINIVGIRNSGIVSEDYSVTIPIDTTVKFEISGKFNSSENNPYKKECIRYVSDSIKLVDYLTDYFDTNFDIESVIPGYETYEENIPYKHETTEYYLNPNYDSTVSEVTNPNRYQYLIKRDSEGNPIFVEKDGVVVPEFMVKTTAGDFVYNYVRVSDEELEEGPNEYTTYYTRKLAAEGGSEYIYTEVEILDDYFDPDTIYYKSVLQIKHYKGDLKYYNRNTGELVDDEAHVAAANPNNRTQALPTTYIGIIKNVAWINRLYMSSDEMYETIREFYLDMVERIGIIKNILFDGGSIKLGLQTTSGVSSKYKAIHLSTGESEYIKNIALSISVNVKFKEADVDDYKKSQVISAIVKYINDLGDNNFTIDVMFDNVKATVPDIEYINIRKINSYENGEVQTILNDTTASSEILTIGQKIAVDDSGNITFEPDVTVNVIEN